MLKIATFFQENNKKKEVIDFLKSKNVEIFDIDSPEKFIKVDLYKQHYDFLILYISQDLKESDNIYLFLKNKKIIESTPIIVLCKNQNKRINERLQSIQIVDIIDIKYYRKALTRKLSFYSTIKKKYFEEFKLKHKLEELEKTFFIEKLINSALLIFSQADMDNIEDAIENIFRSLEKSISVKEISLFYSNEYDKKLKIISTNNRLNKSTVQFRDGLRLLRLLKNKNSYFGDTKELSKRLNTENIQGKFFINKIRYNNKTKALLLFIWSYDIKESDFLKSIPLLLTPILESILERKNIYEKMKKNKQFIDKLLDIFPYPFEWKDEKGRYIGCNKAFEMFVNTPKEKLLKKGLEQLDISPNKKEFLQKHDNFVLKKEKNIFNRLEELKYSDEASRWFNITKTLIYDRKEKYLASTYIEVTALKELQEQNKLFSWVIEFSPSPILITDKEGNIEYVNHKYIKLTGYTLNEILGKNPRLLKSGYHDEKFYKEMWETILDGRIWRNDILNKTKDGRLIWQNLTISSIKDKEGKIIKFVALFDDISELKKIKENLEIENKKLKELQTQLVREEKLASIGSLAAGIAHELNNPIGFVSSNINTLQTYFKYITEAFDKFYNNIENNKYKETEQIIKIIKNIKKEYELDYIFEDTKTLIGESLDGLKRVTNIVQNLRNFSRVDFEKKFEYFDIREGIKNTLVVAKNAIKYVADVKLDFEEIPRIPVLISELNQVFLNIIVNAAQAIKSQGRKKKGTIKIKVFEEKEFVICEISDDGPGIPEKNLNKIFDPFFTTKKIGEGTGLGLSISYDIITKTHKGILDVKSEIGKGTTFIIKLPKKRKENNE